MITIQPQYLTLAKLLDGRLFRIPDYQRAYSWTSRQRTDLFSDLKKTAKKGPTEVHFMAAVVCLLRDSMMLGTDNFGIAEVVDGQQRLTTLIILLNAIKLSLDLKQKSEAKLATELGELLVKSEGDELLLLQTNHDSSHHFATFLRTGTAAGPEIAKTRADFEILSAIRDCSVFVKDWKLSRPINDLVALLKNRLFFLLHEIDSEQAVYTVFEVLNSRGLDVSWFDRLKSILMGAAFEMKNANAPGVIEDLHRIWRDTYAVIGLRQDMDREALRFSATLRTPEKPSRPLSEEDAVELLREQSTTSAKIREVAAWLLRAPKNAC